MFCVEILYSEYDLSCIKLGNLLNIRLLYEKTYVVREFSNLTKVREKLTTANVFQNHVQVHVVLESLIESYDKWVINARQDTLLAQYMFDLFQSNNISLLEDLDGIVSC